MDIHEKLKAIIFEVATRAVDDIKIRDETVLTSDLGFDSIQIISLIVELESQFNIEIDDDDLDIKKLTVYSSLYSMVTNKLVTKDL